MIDRGFENAGNIAALLEHGMEFTVPSNAREMPIKKLMTKAKKAMKDSDAIRVHEGRSYKVAEYEVGIADLDGIHRYVTRLEPDEKNAESENALFDSSPKIKAFVVYDPRKAADDMDNLMAAIGRAEWNGAWMRMEPCTWNACRTRSPSTRTERGCSSCSHRKAPRGRR